MRMRFSPYDQPEAAAPLFITMLGPFAGEGTQCPGRNETSQRMQSISAPHSGKMRKQKLRLRGGKGLPQGHPASDWGRSRARVLTPTQSSRKLLRS